MILEFGLFLTSLVAGGIASVAGFGIGSLITPVLSLSVGTKLAVALVSIPHLIATGLRFWMLRGHIDKKVLLSFGTMSAIGGLTGAVLHTRFETSALTLIFGVILLFTGFMGVLKLSEKMQFHGPLAWLAGMISGVLGGMVGNQGGIRSAAMLGFNISKEAFVATATAVGLIVDTARMPIYFWAEWEGVFQNGPSLVIATCGAVLGTIIGTKALKKIPEHTFKRVVSMLVLLLGVIMFYRGVQSK